MILVSLEAYFLASHWWQVITGLGNGLVPSQQQAITYIIDDEYHVQIIVSLWDNVLRWEGGTDGL